MKYRLHSRKFWWSWLKQDIKRFIYKTFYGFNMSTDIHSGTILPDTGKGKYVSVYVKGDIIQIIDEEEIENEIRIIPYQPNHGVMIESLKNGKVVSRHHLDIRQLNKNIIFASNVEQLKD